MTSDLEATIDIAAAPDRVWRVVGDLRRMPEFSPQCRKTFILGEPREGATMININRDGNRYWWPTTARIVRLEPNRAIAFRMSQNHTVWSFELTPSGGGTTLVQRRDVSAGVPSAIRKVLAIGFGSENKFESVLIDGMNATLAKVKAAVEANDS